MNAFDTLAEEILRAILRLEERGVLPKGLPPERSDEVFGQQAEALRRLIGS